MCLVTIRLHSDPPPHDLPPRDPPPQRAHQPAQGHRPKQPDTPPSIVQMKRELHGLRRAQGIEPIAARAQQIGEIEFDLERRQAKFLKYGR